MEVQKLLSDVQILDLTRQLPGPFCTQILADLGANVIKVEEPVQGDRFRRVGRLLLGTGYNFWAINRNKKSIGLDLKKSAGKEVFKKLVKHTDVILEGFRPGVMDKLELGYKELKKVNSGLIYCSIVGYGSNTSLADRPGHDLNYLATSGLMGMQWELTKGIGLPPTQIADTTGGMMAAIAIISGIIGKIRAGEGCKLEIALADLPVYFAAPYFAQHSAENSVDKVVTLGAPCYNIYRSKDGRHLSLAALEPKFWENFCKKIDRPEWIREQLPKTTEREVEITQELSEIFVSKTMCEWEEFFASSDVCCEPVLNLTEVLTHTYSAERNLFGEQETSNGWKLALPYLPIRQASVQPSLGGLAPGLGQHTKELLLEMGYEEHEIDDLATNQVIRREFS